MTLNRSQAPEFKIPEDISLPKPTKRTLKNGVHLFFIPTTAVDAVRLEINTDTQSMVGDLEKKLVAYFTLHLTLEGTKTKNSEVLDDFFDTYASEVDVISNFEHNGLSLLTTKKHFTKVLPVFRSLFTEATFPEKELIKRKSQKSLSISIQREKNSAQASQLFRNQLFGQNHPYGQIVTEEDVDAILREDLISFYETSLWINPEIFVTGNLDETDLKSIAQAFESLPVILKKIDSPVFVNKEKERIYENREKSLQSSLRIGCHLIPKNHPDYFALYVFNTFLGGYFGSRLIKNIREEKGHTYGIYSSIGSLKDADYWVVMADVQKQFLEEVIDEIYKEIDLLQNELISQEEMEVVRNYMIGNFLSNFSSAFDLIDRFKSIHQAGLDFGYFQRQLDFFRSFNREEILAVGKKYLKKENMIEVIVG
jgi:zinc protease